MEVLAIKDTSKIIEIRANLTEKGLVPLAELFNIGCHVGLRFGDLSQMTFEDAKNDHMRIKEEKTGKYRTVKLSARVKESAEILKAWYAKNHPYDEVKYLFQAMAKSVKTVKPISTSYFNRKLKQVCSEVGLVGNFGSHTLRKSFGYAVHSKTGDLSRLMVIFGHSSEAMTAKYIGIQQEQIDAVYDDLDLTI